MSPRRADIDPVEIPRLMPYVLIADIEHAPFRVRFRLVGTKVVEATGFEFTGKYLDEITLPADEGPVLESYQLASARSEERRVGKECVSKCRSRGQTYH